MEPSDLKVTDANAQLPPRLNAMFKRQSWLLKDRIILSRRKLRMRTAL
jgi:hypothetical protein